MVKNWDISTKKIIKRLFYRLLFIKQIKKNKSQVTNYYFYFMYLEDKTKNRNRNWTVNTWEFFKK